MTNSIFLDSVIFEEIERFSWIIKGVTTTPTFFKRENIDYLKFIKEFRNKYPELELHIEALGKTKEDTISEIKNTIKSEWFDKDKVVLKVPVSEDNLQIVNTFSKEGVRFNTHLVFTPNQASLASLVNSYYVCPLIGRYADNYSKVYGKNLHGGNADHSLSLLKDIRDVLDQNGSDTRVMGSSIRTAGDYFNALIGGADVVTVPTKILEELFNHPMTEDGINIFLKDMGLSDE